MVHYGSILEKAVRNSNMSITEIAKRLHVNRRSIYYWFDKKRLDTAILEDIGVIINHDFKSSLPTTFNNRTSLYFQKTPAKSDEDIIYWKDKYNQLLQRYNATVSELREPVF